MDKLTKEQRHRCMFAIKNKNTKPELLVRKFLFSRGFRYRLNDSRLPGHPDLVLRKYRSVIFVKGCFGHGHEGCKYSVLPKINVEFWRNKIEHNRFRDKEEQRTLSVWKCQLTLEVRQQTLEALVYTLCHIYHEDRRIKPYNPVKENIQDGCRIRNRILQMICKGFFVHPFHPSPQPASDSAVYLRKFYRLLHNILIININKFLQRRGILDLQDADTKAFNHYLTALRSGFFVYSNVGFRRFYAGLT